MRSFLSRLRSSSLASGSAIYLVSSVLAAAGPFVLLPIMVRYLTPAEYGEVGMFLLLTTGLAVFTGLNVHGAASRKYYDDVNADAMRQFVGACFQILLISSLIVFASVWLLRERLSEWLGVSPHWVPWAVAVSAANFIVQLRLGQWQMRKEALLFGGMQVLQAILSVILSIVFVMVFLCGVDGRVSAQIISTLTIASFAVLLLYKDRLLDFKLSQSHLKEALTFGVPLIPHVAGLFLLSAVDRLVINSLLGLDDVGVYMVAAQLAGIMGVVFDAINKAYVPWLFERLKRDRADEKRRIVRLTYSYFFLALLGAAAAFAVGPYAIEVIAGDRYVEAGEVIGWLALGQAFGGMYLMVTNYIFYCRKTGLLSLVTLGSGVMNVALLVLLTWAFGLMGSAIAFAVSMALRFLLTWFVAYKQYPMPWFSTTILSSADDRS